MQIKTWISAMRLRTLPLATASILMGTLLADRYAFTSWSVLLLALSTAICLQILSNLANDYGDFTKGTDNEQRLGNMRALQSGNITAPQMRNAILLFVLLSLVSGMSLLYTVSSRELFSYILTFFLIGLGAIAAALKYTMGKKPYGYRGLGDIFVFVFFGPVAVIGTFLLHNAFHFDPASQWPVCLPAIALGLLSTAVLNTNNIRDIENDKASGKYTLPVQMGLQAARKYHLFLIGTALVCMLVFNVQYGGYFIWFTLPSLFPLVRQARAVYTQTPSPAFNALLKQLSLGILGLVITYLIATWAYHLLNLQQAVSVLPHA